MFLVYFHLFQPAGFFPRNSARNFRHCSMLLTTQLRMSCFPYDLTPATTSTFSSCLIYRTYRSSLRRSCTHKQLHSRAGRKEHVVVYLRINIVCCSPTSALLSNRTSLDCLSRPQDFKTRTCKKETISNYSPTRTARITLQLSNIVRIALRHDTCRYDISLVVKS